MSSSLNFSITSPNKDASDINLSKLLLKAEALYLLRSGLAWIFFDFVSLQKVT